MNKGHGHPTYLLSTGNNRRVIVEMRAGRGRKGQIYVVCISAGLEIDKWVTHLDGYAALGHGRQDLYSVQLTD